MSDYQMWIGLGPRRRCRRRLRAMAGIDGHSRCWNKDGWLFFLGDTRKGKKRINTTNSGRHGGLKIKPQPHGQGNKRRGRIKRSHSFTARYYNSQITEEEKEEKKVGLVGYLAYSIQLFHRPSRSNRRGHRTISSAPRTWARQWVILEGRGICYPGIRSTCSWPRRNYQRNRQNHHIAIGSESKVHCRTGTDRCDTPGNLQNQPN